MNSPHVARYLVINSGSSTLKYAVFNAGDLSVEERGNTDITPDTFAQSLEAILHHAGQVAAVGHRVVHGGERFTAPVVVNDDNLTELHNLTDLAPLHQPHNLHAIDVLRDAHPELPQIACFDTAFHNTQSTVHTLYALPASLRDKGLRRYGFHGLSYEYISQQLAACASDHGGKCIALHLGSGASACAMLKGKSVSSSMGFTALDGLMMATRCGTLDPGLVLHCQTHLGIDANALTSMLYKEAGLKGVSGLSADMRALLEHADQPAVEQAIALYCLYIVRAIGALAADLQGLDTLVFTAGVGEHAAVIRERVCAQLGWLGVNIDTNANLQHAAEIQAADSKVVVRVLPTDEEWVIAQHMRTLLKA